MDRFMADAPAAELVGSALSIQLNARGFGTTTRVRGFQDGNTLALGRHTLRFLETPHVQHWDSMMVFEETTGSLFPADLFLQPGEQPPVVRENLSGAMCHLYREAGIFGGREPVLQAVNRIEGLHPKWIHPMHGGSLTGELLAPYIEALRTQPFEYQGKVLGRSLV